MKGKPFLVTVPVMLSLLLAIPFGAPGAAQVTGQAGAPQSPQGPYSYAFTYQGQLKGPGGPVNGTCDLRFILWDAAVGGSPLGNTLTWEGVEIEDGLFTARLDFGGMDIHTGAARWLEVDVRCPTGVGDYVPLEPRQELTGAPAALSLALPFYAEANVGGPLASFVNTSGDGEAALFSSLGGVALWAESPASDGLHVATAGQDGVRVVSAGGRGLAVDSASGDGVYVGRAGSPSAVTPGEYYLNGVEVAGAQGCGLYVGRADEHGVAVGSAGWYGLAVGSADVHGVYVDSAGMDGVAVGIAGSVGVKVGSAGHDGVFVYSAGNPSASPTSTEPNGFEVAGAQGYGLYIGRADDTGVFVHSAGWNGVVVEEAGGDGVRATNTVYNALYGDTADVQGEWGLYTPDKVHAQNVTLQTLSLIAQVTGPDALSPGDIVAAAGVASPLPGSGAPLSLVRLAGPDAIGVVGVVEGRLALTRVPQPEGEEAQPRLELRSAEGPARPGDYVALTVLGVARVKVDLDLAEIEPGTRLTSDTGGRVRALKTVVVEGLTLAESAPTIGIALAAPDENGLVWVLVNPQ
jgi:hypothetical protein